MSGRQLFTLEQSGNEQKNVEGGEVTSFLSLFFSASVLCVRAAFLHMPQGEVFFSLAGPIRLFSVLLQ